MVVDLAGSILWAFAPEENNEAMFYSGASLVIAGGLAVIASVPTIFVGYVRMNRGIDTFCLKSHQLPKHIGPSKVVKMVLG